MKLLQKLRKDINREIEKTLEKYCDIPLAKKMLDYQLGMGLGLTAQGKRFRPILCLLTAKAIGGSYKKALPAAAAIELIHNFSLIHDDIQDGDEFRRGRMTVWKKWGVNQAINAGDSMHALVNLSLSGLFKLGLKPKVISSVFSVVNSACYRMCEGQVLDIGLEGKAGTGLMGYLDMIKKKTAALIEAAPFSGALASTQDRRIIGCYRNFGLNAGMAFQIFNDVSGFGKDNARFDHIKSDLIKHKTTLPLVLACRTLAPVKKKLSASMILRLIKDSGAVEHARVIGREYLGRAVCELDRSGIKNSAQETLKEYVLQINPR
jgi:geranylgeranyl diphosphate synthase type I